MPADIVTLMDCASCFGVFEITGSTGTKYTVEFGGESYCHCTCEGFKFRQDCKHVHAVYKGACMYNPQYNDGKAKPKFKPIRFTYDAFAEEPCPACGGKTVYVRRAV